MIRHNATASTRGPTRALDDRDHAYRQRRRDNALALGAVLALGLLVLSLALYGVLRYPNAGPVDNGRQLQREQCELTRMVYNRHANCTLATAPNEFKHVTP